MPMSEIMAELVCYREPLPAGCDSGIVVYNSPAVARITQRIKRAFKARQIAPLDPLQGIFREAGARHLSCDGFDIDRKPLVWRRQLPELRHLQGPA